MSSSNLIYLALVPGGAAREPPGWSPARAEGVRQTGGLAVDVGAGRVGDGRVALAAQGRRLRERASPLAGPGRPVLPPGSAVPRAGLAPQRCRAGGGRLGRLVPRL